jgi:hypothetical protein
MSMTTGFMLMKGGFMLMKGGFMLMKDGFIGRRVRVPRLASDRVPLATA